MFVSCLVKYGSKAYSALHPHIPYAIPLNNTLHTAQRRMRSLIVRNIVGEYDAMIHTSKMIASAMIDIAIVVQRVLFIMIIF